MAITYTWKLLSLNKTSGANLNNVVIGTRWSCVGTDEDGDAGMFSGATPFSLDNVDPENFVLWENLTEEIVLSWIQDVLNRGGLEDVQSQIQKQIEQKKKIVQEVTENEFPWVSE